MTVPHDVKEFPVRTATCNCPHPAGPHFRSCPAGWKTDGVMATYVHAERVRDLRTVWHTFPINKCILCDQFFRVEVTTQSECRDCARIHGRFFYRPEMPWQIEAGLCVESR